MLTRLSLCTLAALSLGGGPATGEGGEAGAGGGSESVGATAAMPVLWKVIHFRGSRLSAPPGVVPLSPNVLLFGTVEVEVPPDVAIEFNARGEAVFTLGKDEKPHAWFVRVGRTKILASARSRLVVPPPAVGSPRFESDRFAYRVPTPREFLDQSYDLGDPFDASPFR
jgi:hypothetical protein